MTDFRAFASVAHIRRFLQFGTTLFLKLRAILVAQGTCAALAVTPGAHTHMFQLALPAMNAAVRYPVVPCLPTLLPMFPDFPDNRRPCFFQGIRDFLKVVAFVQPVFDLETLFDGQVRHDNSFLVWGLSD